MRPRRLKTAAVLAGAVIGLFVGKVLLSEGAPAGSRSDLAGVSTPRLVLPDRQRDVGTVSQGGVLRPTFPVRNAGGRRLILVEDAEGCCGQSASPRIIVVAPGDSEDVAVEVDTAQWYGRFEHTAHYSTNDPAVPRFSLEVTGNVGPPGAVREP